MTPLWLPGVKIQTWPWALSTLLDDDLARHLGVDGAPVGVSARLDEDMRELLVGIQSLRVEDLGLAGARHRVRHVVVIGPGHLRAGRDGQRVRDIFEIVDRYLRRFSTHWPDGALTPRCIRRRVTAAGDCPLGTPATTWKHHDH